MASIGDSRSSLLKIEFDINPEDSTADQSLIIESQPVEIKYDAVSSNQNSLVFLSPISLLLLSWLCPDLIFEFLLSDLYV